MMKFKLIESKYSGQTSLKKLLIILAKLLYPNFDSSKEYVVHHVNDSHDDNNLENLALM